MDEMENLMQFIENLPIEVREGLEGKKPRGILRALERLGVEVPDAVIAEVEASGSSADSHDAIMDEMRVFSGNRLVDSSGVIIRI